MKKLKDICQNMNVELPSEAVNSATEIDSIFNELQKSLENLDVQNDQIKRLEEDLKILEETNASIIRHEAHVQLELNCLEEIDILNRELMNRKHFQNKAQWAQITKKVK